MTRNQFGIAARRFFSQVVTVTIAFVAFAPNTWAQPANIDVYEHRTTPVPHQYIHGTLGDAKFQIALPDSWNGKLLIGARGFSGDELSAGAFKTVGLQKGYAYALSDQGWYRFDIIDQPEDKYYESRRRILQLTSYTKSTVRRYYGAPRERTFMVGGSNGGHNTKMMVEDYPGEYDGGLAGYGITSHIEWMGSNTRFVRNFDVFASRIADIVADAYRRSELESGTTRSPRRSLRLSCRRCSTCTTCRRTCRESPFNIGRVPGSEYRWGTEPAVAARPIRCDPRLRDDLGCEVRSVLRSGWRRRPLARRDQSVGPEHQPTAGGERPAQVRQHRQPAAADHHRSMARMTPSSRPARR